MSYIKPNGSEDRYDVTIMPTITQNGYEAVQFMGDEVPDDLRSGFKYYSDNDKLIADLSRFNDFYMHNIYSVKKDTPPMPKGNNKAPAVSSVSDLSIAIMQKVSELDSKVDELQPYVETKPVFIDNTEVIFDQVKEGSISAVLNIKNTQIPCGYEVKNGKIRVFFEPLEQTCTVTLTIN